ncbi:unnamed protein product, partial [Polarella glacialis]
MPVLLSHVNLTLASNKDVDYWGTSTVDLARRAEDAEAREARGLAELAEVRLELQAANSAAATAELQAVALRLRCEAAEEVISQQTRRASQALTGAGGSRSSSFAGLCRGRLTSQPQRPSTPRLHSQEDSQRPWKPGFGASPRHPPTLFSSPLSAHKAESTVPTECFHDANKTYSVDPLFKTFVREFRRPTESE